MARAIFDCPHPIISAVGHEIDFTIADFVADYRAPTPSAAAEVVCSNVVELKEKIDSLEDALVREMDHRLSEFRQTVDHLKKQLIDPKKQLKDYRSRCLELRQRLKISVGKVPKENRFRVQELQRRLRLVVKKAPEQNKQKLQDFERRLKQSQMQQLKNVKQQLVSQAALLDSLSPLKVVTRGYSIVKSNDKVVKSFRDIKKGDVLNIRFAEGSATATVNESSKKQEV